VVMTILTISAVLTLIGNFIADILYGVADPRIRYG
jgi:peptide/nickel transport system permease protein